MAEHRLTAEPTHSRWNRALEPRLTISPGDTVHMSCLDASGSQVTPSSTVQDFLAIDRNRIHALTGPIRIDGAEPADVLNSGALFSAGDAHAAQGDGEVCINGIECPAEVTLRFRVHRHQPLSGPFLESAESRNPDAPQDSWIVVESAPDAMQAARTATERMVELLIAKWSLAPIQAYLLCSVAMKLRMSQVVNEPMITVCAAMPQCVLPSRKIF